MDKERRKQRSLSRFGFRYHHSRLGDRIKSVAKAATFTDARRRILPVFLSFFRGDLLVKCILHHIADRDRFCHLLRFRVFYGDFGGAVFPRLQTVRYFRRGFTRGADGCRHLDNVRFFPHADDDGDRWVFDRVSYILFFVFGGAPRCG